MSGVVDTKDGFVVVKCIKRIPADTTVSLESKRQDLSKEVFEKKVAQAIPEKFKELQQQASAHLLLSDPNKPTDLTQTTQQVLSDGKGVVPARAVVPASGLP